MYAAVLTALLWSWSSICATRSARVLGGPTTNRVRLALSAALLVLIAEAVAGFAHAGRAGGAWWFVVSGAIGLGLGDLAMFGAYTRLGVRPTVLMTQCLAVPLAAALDWWWLGAALTPLESLLCAVVLAGVAVALAPGAAIPVQGAAGRFGMACGVASACGLAVSAVMSRCGFHAALAAGQPMSRLDATALRNLGGLATMLAAWPLLRDRGTRDWRRGAPWLAMTALAGPCIGALCQQWALSTAKAGPVQAVLATLPVMVLPLAWLIDGDRPTRHAIVGGCIAVAGAVAMALLHHR